MAENEQNQNMEQNQEEYAYDTSYDLLHMYVQLKDGSWVWLEGDALERYDRGEI